MDTFLIAIGSFAAFILAYRTYGRWLGNKIFKLSTERLTPAKELQDDVDYCPTPKSVVFGHHFTSIAGTGPIVGPAIAVFWGWLPALIWVLVGSIFIGAVHDFGALVVSMRNKGKTLGDIAGDLISPRARILFLIVLLFCLAIVLGIFGLVIAVIFSVYPESVLSVWIEIPLAVAIGIWVYKRKKSILVPSLIALGIMYLAIWAGTRAPISLGLPIFAKDSFKSAVVVWTLILFVYCFIASVLPVWTLLQPRDFINSHELKFAMLLLFLGLIVASLTGTAGMAESAPAIASVLPKDAPALMPFLFITVACGAVSGFHSLVSSGTSSKQVASEPHARLVGYGSMLLEGGLAVMVILACCAGVGMAKYKREGMANRQYRYVLQTDAAGNAIRGRAAWKQAYGGSWGKFGLPQKVGAFIEGGGNFLTKLGIPIKLAIGIIAVLVASFAATTLDTATRLQRYVVQELGTSLKIKSLGNKYIATGVAAATGLSMAMISGPLGPGSGGLILWPVFGATNQLLACFAFLIIGVYLWRQRKPIWFIVIPGVFMLIFPGWAMWLKIGTWWADWQTNGNGVALGLVIIGIGVQVLLLWLIVEAIIVCRRSRGSDELSDDDPALPAEG